MTRSNLTKVMVVVAVSSIFVLLLVAAPLVGANNSPHTTNQQDAKQRGTQDTQRQAANLTTNPEDPDTPSPSGTGAQWASIATNNGTPAVRNASDSSTSVESDTGAPGAYRNASDSSTSVESDTGAPGAYKVTFPDDIHALGCTATSNGGAQANNQSPISCVMGDDAGLEPNQVQVLTTSGNSDPEQGSNFTVVAYDAPSSSG
jgi:hypothetical protein